MDSRKQPDVLAQVASAVGHWRTTAISPDCRRQRSRKWSLHSSMPNETELAVHREGPVQTSLDCQPVSFGMLECKLHFLDLCLRHPCEIAVVRQCPTALATWR